MTPRSVRVCKAVNPLSHRKRARKSVSDKDAPLMVCSSISSTPLLTPISGLWMTISTRRHYVRQHRHSKTWNSSSTTLTSSRAKVRQTSSSSCSNASRHYVTRTSSSWSTWQCYAGIIFLKSLWYWKVYIPLSHNVWAERQKEKQRIGIQPSLNTFSFSGGISRGM